MVTLLACYRKYHGTPCQYTKINMATSKPFSDIDASKQTRYKITFLEYFQCHWFTKIYFGKIFQINCIEFFVYRNSMIEMKARKSFVVLREKRFSTLVPSIIRNMNFPTASPMLQWN